MWLIAKAWKNGGDLQQATSVLEEATKDGWRDSAIRGEGLLSQWIQMRAELADLYRATGRVKDAEPIEADLLRLLAEADSDHPVLVRLMARAR